MEDALFEKARIVFGKASGMHSPKQIWLSDFLILSRYNVLKTQNSVLK